MSIRKNIKSSLEGNGKRGRGSSSKKRKEARALTGEYIRLSWRRAITLGQLVNKIQVLAMKRFRAGQPPRAERAPRRPHWPVSSAAVEVGGVTVLYYFVCPRVCERRRMVVEQARHQQEGFRRNSNGWCVAFVRAQEAKSNVDACERRWLAFLLACP